MKRPITGRSMDFQGKAPCSPDKSNFLDPFQCTLRDKEMGSCAETQGNDACEQSYNRPVWKSALLFPDIPVTNSSPSNKRSLNVLNASPPSAINEDDSSKEKGLLFKELSFLYEKWSDEDGKEPPCHDAVKIREESWPDCGSSSSNSLHSEVIYEENSYYFHASSSPPESLENSMAMSFNHLSLTSSCDQLLLQSTEPAEWGILPRDTSSQSKTPCQSVSSPSVVPISRYCVFCKKNGETQEFYVSHVIKDSKGHVICPILRDYICPVCSATGSSAHTLSYCPLVKRNGGRNHSIYNKPFNGTVVDDKNPWF